jgi:hypothetical protein
LFISYTFQLAISRSRKTVSKRATSCGEPASRRLVSVKLPGYNLKTQVHQFLAGIGQLRSDLFNR